MKIVQKKVADLKPYEKNAKKHDQTQIDNVAKSIEKYGFVQPVVVDKNNVIVIGHCRTLAAKQIGMETVPCVCVDDLTEEQVKALRIVDNKSNESDWDLELLQDDMLDIDLSDFDFDLDTCNAQFDESQLNDMFMDAEQKEKEPKKIQCPHCGEWFNV